jgi:hypothetical protein
MFQLHGTNNHHQLDVSVHGHDMFSAYSMGHHIVYICSVEFQTAFSEILTDRPTLICSYIIAEYALVNILNIEQFII